MLTQTLCHLAVSNELFPDSFPCWDIIGQDHLPVNDGASHITRIVTHVHIWQNLGDGWLFWTLSSDGYYVEHTAVLPSCKEGLPGSLYRKYLKHQAGIKHDRTTPLRLWRCLVLFISYQLECKDEFERRTWRLERIGCSSNASRRSSWLKRSLSVFYHGTVSLETVRLITIQWLRVHGSGSLTEETHDLLSCYSWIDHKLTTNCTILCILLTFINIYYIYDNCTHEYVVWK